MADLIQKELDEIEGLEAQIKADLGLDQLDAGNQLDAQIQDEEAEVQNLLGNVLGNLKLVKRGLDDDEWEDLLAGWSDICDEDGNCVSLDLCIEDGDCYEEEDDLIMPEDRSPNSQRRLLVPRNFADIEGAVGGEVYAESARKLRRRDNAGVDASAYHNTPALLRRDASFKHTMIARDLDSMLAVPPLVGRDVNSMMAIEALSGMSNTCVATVGALSALIGMLLVVAAILFAKLKQNRTEHTGRDTEKLIYGGL
ncbi:hypothetical protein SeMB42_g00537 [Synchytrium endobioticum]|uniref:Uncharacterized protein n=1 Tax=Synchytrium endobioticum TaxID=286115 RepID=A0A507DRT5_9FUNG|nr:hypothetical protein SeMB42_g00537 [Synchytrium endobioticum]